MTEKITYEKFERERVDSFLAGIYKEYSRSYFSKLAAGGKITVNGKEAQANRRLKRGDSVEAVFEEKENFPVKPENIKLDVVYEDSDIIVINKHPGIAVHPSYGHPCGTLLNALAGLAAGKYAPYLVHRLDKDTSGLIIFAKNEKAKISISKQFQNRAVQKTYYAAVKGIIAENKARIEAPLGRSLQNRKIMSVNPLAKKMAITEFKVIARHDDYTLLEVRIITGRTHQIRSHMKYINHPVIGDRHYGGPETINGKKYERQMLHSYNIAFTHPRLAKRVEFSAPLPEDMKEIFKIAPKNL
jgi:23S rRNA pseudouridine1911/1915/1917 synthase